MSELSTIRNLYWMFEEISNHFLPETSLYEKIDREHLEALHKLEKVLTPQQQKLLENYSNAEGKRTELRLEETYRHGVSFGIRIASEAFRLGKDEITNVFE